MRASDAREALPERAETAEEAEEPEEVVVEVSTLPLPDEVETAEEVAVEVADLPHEAIGARRDLQANDGDDSFEGGFCEPADGGRLVRYTPPGGGFVGLDACIYFAEDRDGNIGGARIVFIVTNDPL